MMNKELVITQKEGHPFEIKTSTVKNAVVSKLTIHAMGYCLSGNIISCWASNSVQQEKLMQTFTITPSKNFVVLTIDKVSSILRYVTTPLTLFVFVFGPFSVSHPIRII